MDVRCNPYAIRGYHEELRRRRDNIAAALEQLKQAYLSLEWEDRVAYVTEQILNRHIADMNAELYRLGGMIRALEEMLDATDAYTDPSATDVSV